MADMPGADAPAVVDAPVPAQGTPAPEIPADQANTEGSPEQPEKPSRTYTEEEHRKAIQERLGKERRSLERRLRAELERDFYKQQLETRQPQTPRTQGDGEPKQQDFQDYEEYLLARAEWRFEQKQHARQRETAAQQEQHASAQRAMSIKEKLQAVADELPDIEDRLMGDVPITPSMVRFLEDSDHGARVLYDLTNRPKDLARIAGLSPTRQIVELNALEAKLTAPPRPTQAPAPIVPANGPSRSTKSWEQMSTAEHVEAYRKRKHRSS